MKAEIGSRNSIKQKAGKNTGKLTRIQKALKRTWTSVPDSTKEISGKGPKS